MRKIITIEGMSCGHCTARVQKSLEALAGVTAVAVSLENGQAVIDATADVPDQAIRDAVYDAGYDVTGVTAQA